ncbi:hypothetical protein CTI12_AA443000 [Artemisia annua]|uniref:Uncharacterized protein n=1 Tax=Artemisia annua TaxID=35608 RepID=A0A2U1LXB8_ARTAN|nr:hypothetical protein CTI12_AA443000 [Artemisia annua]
MQVSFKTLTTNENIVEVESATRISTVKVEIGRGKNISIYDECFDADNDVFIIQNECVLSFLLAGRQINVRTKHQDGNKVLFEVECSHQIASMTVNTPKEEKAIVLGALCF